MRPASRRAATVILVLFAGYVAFRAAVLSTREGLGPDGGFYVAHSWLVRDGLVPYRDFPYWYTPGGLYVHRISAMVLGETHRGILAEIWLEHLATLALLLFVVRRCVSASWPACALLAALFLGSISPLEGFYYVLEPLLNLWLWLSIALALMAAERTGANAPGSLIWPLLAGIAAGAAFWTKQPGVLVLPLAAGLPSLWRGRLELRPALWTIAGFLAVPLTFVLFHPDAVLPALRHMSELFQYVSNRGRGQVIDTWAALRSWIWLVVAFAMGILSARSLAVGQETHDRRAGRVALAILCTGLLLLVPSIAKPYLHYLLVPLPFALFALSTLERALSRQRRHLPALAGAALAVLVLSALNRPIAAAVRRTLLPGREGASSRETEREAAAFIARYAGDSPRMYVIPNSPQYYVALRKPATDESGYEYFPSEKDVRRALATPAPAFIVDRDGVDIPLYERVLASAGYQVVGRNARISAWLPARRPALIESTR